MTGDVRPGGRVLLQSQLPTVMAQLAQMPGVSAHVVREIETPDGKTFKLRDGGLVGCTDGSRYVIENMDRGGFTLRREIPKVKGKAARRAERRARAQVRRQRLHVVID